MTHPWYKTLVNACSALQELQNDPLWINSEYIKISFLYGIYGYTVYIRSYTAYIRYTEIPYTVWANPRHKGKREICRSLPTASFNPVFALRVASKLFWLRQNLNGSIGGLVEFWHIFPHLTLGRFFQLCIPIQSMTPNSHQSWGQFNDDLWISEGADWWTVWRMVPVLLPDIIIPSLCTSPQPSSICWKEK